MNITLRSIGLFGLFLFGALFSLTFLSPEAVEKSAKGFVKHQIEKEVREKQLSLSQSQSALAKKAQGIADKLGIESTQIQQDLDNKLPDKIAATLAAMCGHDCERKKAISQAITSSYLDRIKNIEIAKNTLGEIIKGKYLEIVGRDCK